MNLSVKLIVLISSLHSGSKIFGLLYSGRTEGLSSRVTGMCPPRPDMARVVTFLWSLSEAGNRGITLLFSYNCWNLELRCPNESG